MKEKDLFSSPLVLDGAMGSMLIARGLSTSEGTALWNLSQPEIVREIHKAYFDAGAGLVHTNTFAANRPQLRARELDADFVEINRRAGEHARSVCPSEGYVAGDIGPTGQATGLNSQGDLDEWERLFAEQAEVLVDAGVDVISIETMYDLKEALSALRGVRSAVDLPVLVSLTFNKTPRGFFSAMGDTPSGAIQKLVEDGASAVGSNCTLTSAEMVELLQEMVSVSAVPVHVQPNAGKPRLESGKTVYDESPAEFARHAVRMF